MRIISIFWAILRFRTASFLKSAEIILKTSIGANQVLNLWKLRIWIYFRDKGSNVSVLSRSRRDFTYRARLAGTYYETVRPETEQSNTMIRP